MTETARRSRPDQQGAGLTESDCRVGNRDVGPRRRRVVDVPCTRNTRLAGFPQQFFHLASCFAGDGIDKLAAEPFACRGTDRLRSAQRNAADEALVVQYEGDITRDRHQHVGQFWGNLRKRAQVARIVR